MKDNSKVKEIRTALGGDGCNSSYLQYILKHRNIENIKKASLNEKKGNKQSVANIRIYSNIRIFLAE